MCVGMCVCVCARVQESESVSVSHGAVEYSLSSACRSYAWPEGIKQKARRKMQTLIQIIKWYLLEEIKYS